jgi:hypothetical protein
VLSGTGTLRLVLNEYMPYSTPLIFSTLINNMAWAIGLEITLAILGLLDLSIPTLGTMLYWAINYQAVLLGRWWWVLTPIVLSVCSSSPSIGCRSASANIWIRADVCSAWGQRERHGQHDSQDRGAQSFYVLDVYGKQKIVKAVNDVDLDIQENEIYGIAGESGCGKSTLLKALAAAVEPPLNVVWGRVTYRIAGEDVDVATLSAEEKRRLRLEYIAYVPQGSMSVLNPVAKIKDTYRDFIESHVSAQVASGRMRLPKASISVALGLPTKVSWTPTHTSFPAACASA